jgi:hypothetical protein
MGKNHLSNRASGAGISLSEEKKLRRLSRATGAALPVFSEETRANQIFPIKLVNASQEDKLIVIHPGSLKNVTEIQKVLGITPAAIAKEGVVIVDAVSCSTKVGSLMEYFQEFINRNPSRLFRIQVNSSSEEQLNEGLTFAGISPFKKREEQVLTPAAYKRESNQNTKLVTMTPKDIQLDDQTVMHVNLLAGATLSINLSIGATANQAAVLAKQAEIFYEEDI